MITIVVLAALGMVAINVLEQRDRQQATTRCMLIVVGSALLVLVWLLGFSRLPARRRLGSALGYLGALSLFLVGFRLDGFTGDLLPVFVWRFSEPSRPLAVPDSPKAPAADAVAGLADFPQFFGPHRNGTLAGPKLERDWKEHVPERLWYHPVGAAWSGFVVAGRRAITQEQHGENEAVVCYDAVTGEVLWMHRDGARYEHPVAGIGPRATPTIVGDRVFTQGGTGILNCLELATGAVVWSANILEDAEAELPEWGVAGSPLVAEGVVVVHAGGSGGKSLVAYDRQTGAITWRGGDDGDDGAHWSSPVRASLAGREQILIFGAAGVSGHDAKGGAVLWTHPWRGGHPHIAMPMSCGDGRVLISSGYGTGAELVRVVARDGKFVVESLWKRLALKAKFANFVVAGSVVYGLDDGILTCVDVATGRRRWKRGRYGHGQLLLVGDVLLLTTEHGEVVLVDAVADEHRELARFRAFDHKTWNPPALAGRFLLVRNDKAAACYRLPLAR